MKNKKISLKIIYYVTLIIILFMVSIAIITYSVIYNKMLSMNTNSMKLISNEIYLDFKNLIKIQTNDINNISFNKDVSNLIKMRNSEDTEPSIKYNELKLSLNEALKKYSQDSESDEHAFITDNRGVIISDSNSDYINFDLSQDDFMHSALSGQDSMSGVYISAISGRAVVTFLAPIRDEAGKVIGTAGKSVYTQYFSKNFDGFKYLQNGYIFIVDNSYNVVYDPVKYNINKKLAISEIRNIMSNKKIFDKKVSNQIQYKYKGVAYSACYTSIPELKSVLVLTVNQKEIKNQPEAIGFIIGLLTLIMIIFMIPVIEIIIRRILKPMNVLMKNTGEVSNGNLVVLNKISSNDEIGQLSKSFNYMTESIKQLVFNVKDVTCELMQINDTIKLSQNNITSSMDTINVNSERITNDTTQVKEVVKLSRESVAGISERIENIKEQSNKMLESTNVIMDINRKGIDTVTNLRNVNEDSLQKINDVNESFKNLNNNLENIKEIARMVMAVSKQTHILSLNASIEAARAGEKGAGFKVVANQIKHLSENITGQMNKIEEIVSEINSNMLKTEESIDVVNKVSSTEFTAVNSTIKSFNAVMQSIDEIIENINSVDSSIDLLNIDNNNVVNILNSMETITSSLDTSIKEVNGVIKVQVNDTKDMDNLINTLQITADKLNSNINKFKIV